ncbi:phospholipid-transporting ATPase ABCA3-like isoform X2 [Dermacentor albipictus]|uniref:phospholipid-transporting ATPase ABCA3-like isoform X2 n=1 Tax=Dermacentor albipictus TaxID=60249 RepID=UPI0031FD0716
MQQLQALAVVLWKNLWVQPFRHHYVSTASEMFIVVLCFGVLWNHERPAPGTLRRSADAVLYDEEPALDEAFIEQEHVLVYGPRSAYAQDIMSAFRSTKSRRNSPGVPQKTGHKMVHVANEAGEVALLCAEVRRQFHGRDQHVICIEFGEDTQGTKLLNYTVHVTTQHKGDYSPGVKFPWTFREPAEDIDVYDHVQKIMAVVETRHIELQTSREFSYQDIFDRRHVENYETDMPGIEELRLKDKKEHWPHKGAAEGTIVKVSLRRFPHPSMPDDSDNYRARVSYILGIAYLLPFCMRLKEIVQDKETGINELQMIMGLSSLVHTLGHLITGVALTMLYSVVPIFCMTVLPSGGPAANHAYLQGASVTLLLFVFFMFSVMLSFHALLVATIFINTSMAVMFGVFYWVVLTLAVPLMIIDGITPSLAHYVFTSESRKYYSSYTPCLGTYWILKMIGIAVDFDGAAGWDLFWTFAFGLDSITIGYVVTTMAESFVLMLFLIWYLSLVLPWNSKTPRPFYFLLQKFGNLTALDSVDLKILDKQITVILGHNAAGKTTILKTLAGIVRPTRGCIQVCGYDMVTRSSFARKNISFCQQDDVFFADLTVYEHLIYFGLLKGVPYSLIKQRVEEVLDDLYLTDSQHQQPCHLSGGVRKRLSVAIAVVLRPRVILLDEPSAGIDPENQGDLWDLLLDIRQTCAVVVTTHDLQEADALADRLIIIAYGRVLCSGSSAFIRKNFGPGYQLIISKSQAPFNLVEVMKIIKNTAPAAQVKAVRPDEVDIDLNVVGTEGFDVMFAQLERASRSFGINAISVTATTLEELFVRINLSELSEHERGAWLNKDDDVSTASSMVHVQPEFTRTLAALLSKRAMCLTRSWTTLALMWAAPFAIFWVLLLFEKSALRGVTPLFTDRVLVPLTLAGAELDEIDSPEAFVQFGRDQVIPAAAYRALVEQHGATVTTFLDAQERLLFLASQDFVAYSQQLLVGAVFDENGTVEAWFNQYLRGGKAIAMSMVHTALLRNLTESSKEVPPGLAPAALISSSESVVEGTLGSLELVVSALSSASAITTAARALFLPLTAGLLVAAFALFPTAERVSRAKDIQMMTGMSGRTFWIANYVFDLQTYLIVWALMGVLHAFYYAVTTETLLALVVAVLAFSLVALPIAYMVSLFARTQPGAFSLIALSFTIIGTALMWNGLIRSAERRHRGEDLVKHGVYEYLMALVPAFAFPRALTKALELDAENRDCLNRRNTLLAGSSLLWHMCSRDPSYHSLGTGIYYCCHMELTNSTDWEPLSPFGLHSSGILPELLFMLVEGVMLFVLLDRLDSGRFLCAPRPPAPAGQGAEATAADEEVREERKLVDAVVANGKFTSVVMAARGLEKKYGTTEAVRSVSLALRTTECLGLLGLNGAGKTTTLEMLAALLRPNSGDAYISGLCMSQNPRKWQSGVGYCLQSGGLLEQLTGSEFLRLMANLRGIPLSTVELIVSSLLRVVGIDEDVARLPCGSYSHGDKRKLSVAAAMVGLPRLVFLDEPVAGVDILARKTIFQALQAIITKGYSSIILSSNSMDVCEANCSRVGILVSGQLQCLGSVPQLLVRFGRGFTLQIKCVAKDASNATALEEAVATLFPGILLTDVHPGLFQFAMKEMLQWSVLFARVNQLHRYFQLEYVNVSSTGLEEVFIDFVRDTRRPALAPPGTAPHDSTPAAAKVHAAAVATPAAAVVNAVVPAGTSKGIAAATAQAKRAAPSTSAATAKGGAAVRP